MDYVRNQSYFLNMPVKKQLKMDEIKIPLIIVGIGVIALFFKVIVGLIIMVIGGIIINKKRKELVSDEEIDSVIKAETATAIQRGLSKLGLDEDEVKIIDPIVVDGPLYQNISMDHMYKIGKNGYTRSSNYEVTVLFFSETQMYVYNYRFSIINNERNEITDEYFYRDVVSVATSSTSRTVRDSMTNMENSFSQECFKLTTSGGNSIECTIQDFAAVERSIQGMKQLLREKKSA